ncbi:MAG: HEAT repeat domain-containing protein [Phycisphaerae bacterium]|nr:HEAT repeat domain-containing protein [Phycisphaerae bacterium]HOL26265.1 HEAT repeat domain-containing protein [Phycisphaerae bacterium]HPP20789.1 HEAT repeat domain-containing protein [Phycisphaerae bacterium]HXK87460.1 HEAT repeat domain-containing protein [Phycisphaerae bacterium]
MVCKPIIFEVLKEARTSAADKALAAVLGRVEGPAARAVVETLLARHTREGLKGLVAAWHRFDEPLRDLMLSRSEEVFSVLREAFASSDEQTRINVLQIMRRGNFYCAAYLLDPALRDRASAVRSEAAQTVRHLAEQLLWSAPRPEVELHADPRPDEVHRQMVELEGYREDRRQLVSVIEAAVSSFEFHQHAEVVEAAMWFCDDLGSRFWKMLLTPGSRLTRAAQNVLGHGRDPRMIPFMFTALGYAEFRPIVAQVLASCTDPAFLEAWLGQSWRLVEPRMAKSMVAIRDLACTRNQLLDVVCLPEEAQRHFARCVLAAGLEDKDKLDVLKELYRRGGATARRAALWALTRLGDPRTTGLLRTIAAAGEGPYSLIARFELVRRRPSEYPPGELLAEVLPQTTGRLFHFSESPTVGRERLTAGRYWQDFDRMTEAERVRFGKELLIDGRLSPATVAGWLARPETVDVLRALRMVVLLDLAGSVEEQLYRLCRDPRPEVRSAAVSALGHLDTPTSRRVLHATLDDPDPRVQANTVESLDRIGGENLIADLIPKLASPDNRTRANAVRALLKLGVRDAAETLLLMLGDENRAHRVSALWLVEQMHLLPLASRVMNMAESDADEQIRLRARVLAGKILDHAEKPAMAGATGKGMG